MSLTTHRNYASCIASKVFGYAKRFDLVMAVIQCYRLHYSAFRKTKIVYLHVAMVLSLDIIGTSVLAQVWTWHESDRPVYD
jgi:hypothetical protein